MNKTSILVPGEHNVRELPWQQFAAKQNYWDRKTGEE